MVPAPAFREIVYGRGEAHGRNLPGLLAHWPGVKSPAKTKSKSRALSNLKRINRDRFLAAATDGNDNIITKQVIPYSSFLADELTLYFVDDVLLLPSEY